MMDKFFHGDLEEDHKLLISSGNILVHLVHLEMELMSIAMNQELSPNFKIPTLNRLQVEMISLSH